MPTIKISDLSFAYPGADPLFSSLSLNIDTSWRLGLVGRNGVGKTTFLRILEGKLEYKGSVITPFPLPYFPPAIEDPGQNAEEFYQRFRPGKIFEEWRLRREADFLKLSEESLKRPLGELSGGERVKVLLSLLFMEEELFPLIDEPTGNLDRTGRLVVADYLARKSGFILVSHDRELLDRSADHIIALYPEEVECESGNFSSWWENRQKKEKSREIANLKLKKEIKRLSDSAKKSSEWSRDAEKGKFGSGPVDRGFIGAKAASLNKKSKNIQKRREKAAEERSELIIGEKKTSELSLKHLDFKGGAIARAIGLSAGYGEKTVIEDIGFTINPGDRLALVGPNGCGKSLVLKLLLGEGQIHKGELIISQRVKISYIPQIAGTRYGNLKDMAIQAGLDESRFKSLLKRLGFARERLDSDFNSLSEGQKKKAYLAASLLTEAHFYVWDEPLSHVDIVTRMEIEDLLVSEKPTIIICEHDAAFLEKVATSFLTLGG